MKLRDYLSRLTKVKPSFAELRQIEFTSPQMICAIVAEHVQYRPDPKSKDVWTAPMETWVRGYGDCEDMAMLIAELCQARGFPCCLAVLFSAAEKAGHAFVSGTSANGGFDWASSNGGFRQYERGKGYPTGRNMDRLARDFNLGWSGPFTAMILYRETVDRLLAGKSSAGRA